MFKIGWFSTGRGEGSRKLLELVQSQIDKGNLPVSIEFVFQNREYGEGEGSDQFQELVHSYGIPLVSLSSQRFRRKEGATSFSEVRLKFDRMVMRMLEGYQPNLCILAGYMLILGPELARKFTAINLHPALPDGPTGTWQEVIWQLIDQEDKETGSMIHLVNDNLDRGPLVTYHSFPLFTPLLSPLWKQIKGRNPDNLRTEEGENLPLFQHIREEGLKREPHLLVETIRALAEGKFRVTKQHVVDRHGNQIPGYCLSDKVEAALQTPNTTS